MECFENKIYILRSNDSNIEPEEALILYRDIFIRLLRDNTTYNCRFYIQFVTSRSFSSTCQYTSDNPADQYNEANLQIFEELDDFELYEPFNHVYRINLIILCE